MGLKRKIRTLLDPEKRLHASIERKRRKNDQERPFPLTPEGLLSGLDQGKLEAIRSPELNPAPGEYTQKYLELEKWFPANLRRVLNMGLDVERKKRILDIGSGAGYLLYICKRLGHDPLGLDVPDANAAWYGKMFELYGVPRVLWYIHPFKPLPDLGARFDYVTAFMVCFNQPKSEDAWKIEEWRFFLDDLWTHLKPGAIVWFELNPALDGAHYTPELRGYFESRGAIVDGKRLVWGMDQMRYRVLLQEAKREAAALRKAAAASEAANPAYCTP